MKYLISRNFNSSTHLRFNSFTHLRFCPSANVRAFTPLESNREMAGFRDGNNISNRFNSSFRMHKNFLTGFTLLEIIVVIVIVGILAGLLTPVANVAIRRTKIQETKEKMEILNKAMLLYYEDYAQFPEDTVLGDGPTDLAELEAAGYVQESEYSDDYAYDANRVAFVYTYEVGAVSATLRSFGPDRTDDAGGDDDIIYIVQAKDIWKKWRQVTQERLASVNAAVEKYKRAGNTITTGDDSEMLSEYLDAAAVYDPWGRVFKYDDALSTFYSYGSDGDPGTDRIYPAGIDTTP